MLPEDTLLEIFDLYRLDAMESSFQRPWKWHRLAHVCRKWRNVIFMSPRRLDLRVLCENGAPIESILGSWPTLPLVVRHYDPKSKSLPNNVAAALRRIHRLCEIELVLPSSSIGSIVDAMQEPLHGLESIRVTIENATGPPKLVREAFLGGSAPHLREIKLDGIAFPFPAIRQVLLSTNKLVELHLTNIPNDAYFSPDDLVTGLTTLVQLKRLSVGFRCHPIFSPSTSMTGSIKSTTLPSLTSLGFYGASEYLEEFVAQIDLPALHTITIRLFNQIFFEIPQFCQFIRRQNILGSSTAMIIRHLVGSVSIAFGDEIYGKSEIEGCLLKTSCGRLDWQLSFATQISSQLSPLLSSIRCLNFHNSHELPTGEEDVDSTQWLELFRPFTHVTDVSVFGEQLVPSITQALVAEEMSIEVLPELTWLSLKGYGISRPAVSLKAEQFVATRKLSGRTVRLTVGE